MKEREMAFATKERNSFPGNKRLLCSPLVAICSICFLVNGQEKRYSRCHLFQKGGRNEEYKKQTMRKEDLTSLIMELELHWN